MTSLILFIVMFGCPKWRWSPDPAITIQGKIERVILHQGSVIYTSDYNGIPIYTADIDTTEVMFKHDNGDETRYIFNENYTKSFKQGRHMRVVFHARCNGIDVITSVEEIK